MTASQGVLRGNVTVSDRTESLAAARESLLALARLAEQAARILPESLARAGAICARSLGAGGKLLVCGNGGSASDASHLVGELVGRMGMERRSLPAICLGVDPSVVTCIANDYGYDQVFARQVEGLARPGDVLVAFSTSGRSKNVLGACEAAREMQVRTVVVTGAQGDPLLDQCDCVIRVPSADTPRIQEIHTAVLHAVCDIVEQTLFQTSGKEVA